MKASVLIFIVLAGCATAPTGPLGPQMAANQVGIVRLGTPSKLGRAKIEKLDDQPVKGWLERFELPPGRHTLDVSFIYGDGITAFHSERNCPLQLMVRGGGVYQVEARVNFKNRTWSATLMDVINGTVLDECKAAASSP